MKTYSRILITSMIVCLFISVSAQVQKTRFTLLGHSEVKTGTDQIQQIFVDTVYKKYVLWFNAVTPGQNENPAGVPEQLSQSGIYDMDGNRFVLHPWEKPLKYHQDTLIGFVNPHFLKTDAYLYTLKNGTLSEKLSRLQMGTHNLVPLQSGNYISWNENEGPASKLDLLGPDFNLVQHLLTGFSAFRLGQIDEYAGKVLLIVHEAVDNQADSMNCKLLVLNGTDGSLLHQLSMQFPVNQSPQAFMDGSSLYINTYDVANAAARLTAYTFSGQMVYQTPVAINPLTLAFLRDRKIALIPGNEGLKTLSLKNGQTIWNVDISAFRTALVARFPKAKDPENLMVVSVCSLDTDDKNPSVLARVCDYRTGSNGERIIAANYIFLITSDGSISDILDYGSTPEILEVLNVRGELWLLDEKNLNRYEIIKN